MKKNIKFTALSLLSLGLFLNSCASDDDGTGHSTLDVNPNVTGIITPDWTPGVTIALNEGDDNSYTYTVTTSEPQPVDIYLNVIKIAGDADADDFEAEPVRIPAYSTTGSGTIKILNDDIPELTETLTLQIGDINTSNASIPYATISFEIENYLGPLELVFDWDLAYTYGGPLPTGEFTLCDEGMDIDILVLDADQNDTDNIDAQTGDCPEALSMSLDEFEDGIYHFIYYLYDDAGISGSGIPSFDIPFTITYSRPGSFTLYPEKSFERTLVLSSTSGNGANDYLMSVKIENGIFTILNDATVVAEGRQAAKKFAKSGNRAKAKTLKR